MKLGIIGCGIITQESHIPALIKMQEQIEVIALCNHSLPKAEATSALLGKKNLPLYTDWKEMIHNENKLNAVLISLPIPMNYPVSKVCLEAGLHVLCEKPVAMNGAEADKSLDLLKDEGPLYMTAENFQYRSSVRKAIELIGNGKIGALHSLQWNLLHYMEVDNKYNKTQWRCHNDYPGGYVMDGGVHFIHNLRQIAGPIHSVYAKTKSVNPLLGTMDMSFAIIEHESAVVSSINMGWQHCDEDTPLKMYGTQGSLSLKEDHLLYRSVHGKTERIPFNAEDSFYEEWMDFYKSVNRKTAPQVKQEEVVQDVKIIEAMILSTKEGREIIISK